jgi:hypothetical protein
MLRSADWAGWLKLMLALISLAGLAAPSAALAEARVAGCTVTLTGVDEHDVPSFRGECEWSIAPTWVTAVLTDPERLDRGSSLLEQSRRLPDGRIVNVQKTGWPFENRQSTVAVQDERLPNGGVRRSYRLAEEQAPLADGAVQVAVDEGRWEVSASSNGTRVVLEMRYAPGGNLPARVVQSMSPKYIAKGLDELRVSAEKLARETPSMPSVASGPPEERAMRAPAQEP